MKQVFLNRDKTAIESVIDYLFNCYADKNNGVWNLSNVLLVVLSVRVRKETLQQLLIRAEKEQVLLETPQIVTIGRAPEYLYRQTRPLADEFTQYLAWTQAVEKSSETKRNRFLPLPPRRSDLTEELLFGQMLGKIHENLAAEKLSFTDVVEKLKELQDNPSVNLGKLNLQNEIDRWKYLSEVETAYLSILDNHNLWDRQAARRFALKSPQPGRNGFPGDFEIDFDIVLAGIVDLNKIQKEMLQRVESHVTALIYAPESESKGFDKFGALNVEYWSKDLLCPLSDNQIVQVEKPEEQVLCAFNFIQQICGSYSPNDITIGVPDEKIIPYIKSTADKLKLQIDNSIGIPLSSTAPGALLLAIANYIELHDYESFASLVRHPSVYDALYQKKVLDENVDIISILDEYQQEYFPLDVSTGFLLKPSSASQEAIKEVLTWINKWLADLNKKEIDPKEFRQIIAKIFDNLVKDKYMINRNAQAMLINIAGKLEMIPDDLTGSMTSQSALNLILLRSESYTLPNGSEEYDDENEDEEYDAETMSNPMIHLAGWLELVWDSAPVLTILSFNEGVIPQSVNAHLFLPNELRKALGIIDNDRRFARDAYALKAMSSSKERLLAICGRVNTEGKPTLPSRLLFNKGEQKDQLASFALQAFRFFDDKQPLAKLSLKEPEFNNNVTRQDYLQWAADTLSGGVLKGVVKNVSATKFQEYIQCPFRFYLKHVLQIQPTDYNVNEMSALSFGSFVHKVLQEWSEKEIRSGRTNWQIPADELFETLSSIVDKHFKLYYPKSSLPGIAIQKEIIKRRLKAFAEFQSAWEGKTIAVEQEFEQIVKVRKSKNDTITLKGKIDRIDMLPDGSVILLDYKTSGKGDDPRYDHLDSEGNWVKLQLPIYRQLILANKDNLDWMDKNTNVQVGYINISQDAVVELKNPCVKPEGDRSRKPIWDDNVFSSAEDLTINILNDIYNGVFWPFTPSKELKYDDYADLVSWLEEGIADQDIAQLSD